jgi:DNA-binding NarL/FixJ family response regulator
MRHSRASKLLAQVNITPNELYAFVDDHALFRDGVKQILQFEEDFRIVGEAADGDSGVEVVRRVRSDVVLLDVELPGSHSDPPGPETKIIILGMHYEPSLVNRLVDLGVCGYLLKSATRLELLTAVRGTARHPDQVILSVPGNPRLARTILCPTSSPGGSATSSSSPSMP